MPTSRSPYPAEFRQPILAWVQAGRTPEQLETPFEPRAQTLRNWVQPAAREAGKHLDGLTSVEREELARRRRENRQLKLEREILATAAVGIARETGAILRRGSNS